MRQGQSEFSPDLMMEAKASFCAPPRLNAASSSASSVRSSTPFLTKRAACRIARIVRSQTRRMASISSGPLTIRTLATSSKALSSSTSPNFVWRCRIKVSADDQLVMKSVSTEGTAPRRPVFSRSFRFAATQVSMFSASSANGCMSSMPDTVPSSGSAPRRRPGKSFVRDGFS